MSFSRAFLHPDPGVDHDILQTCPEVGNVVCKTSFKKVRVEQYLTDNSTADEIEVTEIKKDGTYYFAILAKIDGVPLDDPLEGDLPCPTQCLPPPMLPVNYSFDPAHIAHVIATNQCQWLQVHRSRIEGQADFNNFSIYALTGLPGGSPTERKERNDRMYTTIN